jgi:hypothetical protein
MPVDLAGAQCDWDTNRIDWHALQEIIEELLPAIAPCYRIRPAYAVRKFQHSDDRQPQSRDRLPVGQSFLTSRKLYCRAAPRRSQLKNPGSVPLWGFQRIAMAVDKILYVAGEIGIHCSGRVFGHKCEHFGDFTPWRYDGPQNRNRLMVVFHDYIHACAYNFLEPELVLLRSYAVRPYVL